MAADVLLPIALDAAIPDQNPAYAAMARRRLDGLRYQSTLVSGQP